MKRKQQGFSALLIIILAVGSAAIYQLSGAWSQVISLRIAPLKILPDIQLPGAIAMADIKRLVNEMQDLAYPEKTQQQPSQLGLFGYYPMTKHGRTVKREKRLEAVNFNYKLTFAIASASSGASAKKSFCVIDGKFYQQGSQLPDGGQIQKIDSKRVLIKKSKISRWIPMAPITLENQKNKKSSKKNGAQI